MLVRSFSRNHVRCHHRADTKGGDAGGAIPNDGVIPLQSQQAQAGQQRQAGSSLANSAKHTLHPAMSLYSSQLPTLTSHTCRSIQSSIIKEEGMQQARSSPHMQA